MEKNRIQFYVGRNGITPTRKLGDAGFDFYVPVGTEAVLVNPHEAALINTKIRSYLPEGIALIAFNKSGVATKKGLQVGACVVDRSYQGEIHIHVYNWGKTPVLIEPGDKLVQFVPVKIEEEAPLICYEDSTSLKDFFPETTERGSGGFGSTGDKA